MSGRPIDAFREAVTPEVDESLENLVRGWLRKEKPRGETLDLALVCHAEHELGRVTGGSLTDRRELMRDIVARVARREGIEDPLGDATGGGNGSRPAPVAEQVPAVPPEAPLELARSADILADFARTLHGRGVAGEDRFASVVYLCVTSRVLERPVSVAAKGPSSAGKSYIVEKVLDFFPASAYYALSAMSEHALAYSEEPLKHRMLVLYEAVGLESDFASYLVRSLLSEGCIRYETVEKQKGAGMVPKLIVREGPTGLIVTTTAVSLHPENETRLLSVAANDTPEQTRQVLRMLACENGLEAAAELEPWRALQTWVGAQDNRVAVPFAPAIAELVPPIAVRLRRDFTTVLTLVKAHAVLHQATRERDDEGRIVATLADYGAVRELVADLVADEVEATVPATVSETVAAVATLYGEREHACTYLQLAEVLGLDKSAAMRRAKVAIRRGYLKNLETRRGQAAKLVPGEPLPAAIDILPTVATLTETGCTVARVRRGDIHEPGCCSQKTLP